MRGPLAAQPTALLLQLLLCLLLFRARLSSALSPSAARFYVLRVVPRSNDGLRALDALRALDHAIDIDFWKDASHVGDYADIMISDRFRPFLQHRLDAFDVAWNVTVPDVEKLILRNENKLPLDIGGKRLNDDPILDREAPGSPEGLLSPLRSARYAFGDYASYAEMMRFMRAIEFYYPQLTRIVRIGTTHEGRPIEGLKIGFPISDTTKPAVYIDGNIHAREWASSHTALFIINELVAGYGSDPEITRQLNASNFFVFPCLNPDGYEYTRSSPTPAVRLWRKNRSPERCARSLWGGERCCSGVDLNRNFDFHWAETGSSSEPCSNIFHGSGVFSEPETRAVEDFLRSDELRGRVEAFFTLHTYGQLFIHPFSHTTHSYPADIEQLRRTAMRATSRLQKKFGTRYQVGTGADILAPASGGSDDWAKDKMRIKYVYLIELRPEEQLSNGFILHKRELIPTGSETFEAIKEVVNAMLAERNASDTPSPSRSRFPQAMRLPSPVPVFTASPRTRSSSSVSPTPTSTVLTTTTQTERTTTRARGTTRPTTPSTTPRTITTTRSTTLSTTTRTTTTTSPTTTTPPPTTTVRTTSTSTTSTTPASTTTASTTPTSTTSAAPTSTARQPLLFLPVQQPIRLLPPAAAPPVTPSTRLPIVPTRLRPWLTYSPKTKRIVATTIRQAPERSTTMTPLVTTAGWSTAAVSVGQAQATEATSFNVDPRIFLPNSTRPESTTLAEPASTPFSTVAWWLPAGVRRHTHQPPLSPPVYSTIFTTHPELRSSLSDSLYLRTHNRVSTLHIERAPDAPEPPPVTPSVIHDAEVTTADLDEEMDVSAPPPFLPDCRDLRLSCAFWVRNAPGVCIEQAVFMRAQCAATCRFCTAETTAPDAVTVAPEGDFRTFLRH